MTKEFQPAQFLQKLKLPDEDLAVLNFCRSSKAAAVATWAHSLPAMQVEKVGALLYEGLPEVTRLKTSAANRLDILEELRPYVQQCIQSLAKGFLNQPLTMEEKKIKTATVAQALQKHMTNGYLQVIRDLAPKFKLNKSSDPKLELAVHRAVTGCGLMLLRCYQLYTPIPGGLWIELHSLYRLAETLGFAERSINDSLLQRSPACSIYFAYLRALLLASSRPNQLRQLEVLYSYEVLEDWVQFIRLLGDSSGKPENLFLVNLSSDSGPLYKSRFTGSREHDIRELDLSALVTVLKRQQEQKDGSNPPINVPKSMSTALIEHLIQAWSVNQQRSFERQASKSHIEVCVGIRNLHLQITQGVAFEEFLGQQDEEIEEITMSHDPWATNFGSAPGQADDSDRDAAPLFTIRVVDVSPGGYCLEWSDTIPNQVRAGEILGLREEGRHRWGLGVIRWIQQQRNATRLGIQLLAPKTTPYGACIQQATGDFSDYMRVLMLPELKAANQPSTLLTANLPFQEYDKITLNHQGEIQEAQLTRRIFGTGSISQFEFRITVGAQSKKSAEQDSQSSDTTEENFSSVWDDPN